LYNVTLHVVEEIINEWLVWMKEDHLPEVMASGKFTSFSMYKIKNHEAGDNSHNYSVQYIAQNMEDYESYARDFGPALKQKTMEKYGDKIIAFRTILEKII